MKEADIDYAPAPLRALFLDFPTPQVFEALIVVGFKGQVKRLSSVKAAIYAEDARKLLIAEQKRQEHLRGVR